MNLVELPSTRVLLTRPAKQAHGWAQAIRTAGGIPIIYPTIEVQPPPSWQPLDEALARLATYDWIVFSSAAAVRFTLSRLEGRPFAPPQRVAAVGAETSRALEAAGRHVDLVPDDQRGLGLAAALSALPVGTRVLFPQAIGGRTELRDALLTQGCIVDVVPASQTVPVSPLREVPAFDVATFASPSALRAFVAGAGLPALRDHAVVVLGATTFATAVALNISATVASEPSAEAMVAAIAQAAANA